MGQKAIIPDIQDYYRECHANPGEGWLQNDHRGIHVGYFDGNHTDHDSAIENMTRKTAQMVDIGEGDRVLDCGCGVGGPATWLADTLGAEVTGINISDEQLKAAREMARRKGVEDRTTFVKEDFTEMSSLEDDSFDVVWGLEAICYAENKRDVIEQASRVLKDGGRFVCVDGYMTERDLDPDEQQALDNWLDGWALPNLAHIDDFTRDMTDVGFSDVRAKNIDSRVDKSSKFMYYYGLVGYPIAKALQLVGRRSETQVKNIVGCYYQRRLFVRDVCAYYMVAGRV